MESRTSEDSSSILSSINTSDIDNSQSEPSLASIDSQTIPKSSAETPKAPRRRRKKATARQPTPIPNRSTRSHPQQFTALFPADTTGIPPENVVENQRGRARQKFAKNRGKACEERQQGVTPEAMSGRPRNARGLTGRDGGKENDLEADLLSRILEGIRKVKEHNDEAVRVGSAIMDLEEEIKAVGHSTPEQHKKLDLLYREQMRHSEAEKKALDEEDIVNNIAVLSAMKSSDEPAPRNGTSKQRKNQKQILESDIIESPSTPNEGRGDILKRVKGTSQRSSSVASQNRASIAKEDPPEPKVEKSGPLTVGTEVFYKLQASDKDEGVGQHQIIKKIYQEKKGFSYDLRDPDKEQATRNRIPARHLAVIPTAAAVTAPIYPNESRVFARYPDTDTFYEAEVRSYTKGGYALLFEGEEDTQNEHMVERRYVFDPSRWR